ncbi:MAG: thiamine pyrophosphate-dependent enzyme [Terracidiphilus sp.]
MKGRSAAQKITGQPQAAASKNGFSLISREKLIELYAAMVKGRMIAERAALLSKKGVGMGDLNASMGREAVIAGVSVDLLPEDTLSPSDCDVVASFIKGVPLEKLFLSLCEGNGQPHAAAKLRYDPQANVIAPATHIGTQLEIACGAALVHKSAKNNKIVVVCGADGSDSRECESWSKSLHFAGQNELPMLFVRHSGDADAQESRTSSGSRTSPESRTRRGRNEGSATTTASRSAPVITVDGSDAVAVYRVASESINRARLGRGPTLIECSSLGHEPGTEKANGARRTARDPIDAMETYLMGKGLFSREMKRQIAAGFSRELDAATRFLSN